MQLEKRKEMGQGQACLPEEIVNLFELEKAAQAKMTNQAAWDYYASGAMDEITLRENRQSYERIFLSPRMLVDVSQRDLSTKVLGQKIEMPVIIAPTAFQKLAHEDGEIGTIKAANRCGTIMCLSTLATSSIEEVGGQADNNLWFQLYVYKDREITKDLVARAKAAGAKALVVTVDSPLLGRRERDIRNRFSLPKGLTVANLSKAGLDNLPADVKDSGLAAYIASLYDESLTWKDLKWIAQLSDLPLLVKGILRSDDAKRAIKCGAAGIIVSNHGGRQLDTAIPTISALALIKEAVPKNCELFVDGGIRRGSDILKALALGAKAVLIGRPVLWGLALAGSEGVELALNLLRKELDLSMALSGVSSIKEIKRDLLVDRRELF